MENVRARLVRMKAAFSLEAIDRAHSCSLEPITRGHSRAHYSRPLWLWVKQAARESLLHAIEELPWLVSSFDSESILEKIPVSGQERSLFSMPFETLVLCQKGRAALA
jgi:hypothetical protein